MHDVSIGTHELTLRAGESRQDCTIYAAIGLACALHAGGEVERGARDLGARDTDRGGVAGAGGVAGGRSAAAVRGGAAEAAGPRATGCAAAAGRRGVRSVSSRPRL